MIDYKFLLISGCPRSGTTFLNLVLNSHPKVSISNECNLIKIFDNVSEELYQKEKKLNEFVNLERSLSKRENWSVNTLLSFVPKRKNTIKSIIYSYLSNLEKKPKGNIEVVGDKFPKYYKQDLERFSYINELPIKLIHITRDPIEVVSSMMRRYENSKKGLDWWKSVKSITEGFSEWIEAWNWRSKIRKAKGIELLDLNYNKCILNPNEMYEAISKFLDIENNFDRSILSDKNIELYINKKDAQDYSDQMLDMAEKWNDFPLILNKYNNQITYKEASVFEKLIKKSKKLFRRI
tara:strand:- start:304 stop:1182 length:879 start_codon:yes stop_codon:yes gene_type:complete